MITHIITQLIDKVILSHTVDQEFYNKLFKQPDVDHVKILTTCLKNDWLTVLRQLLKMNKDGNDNSNNNIFKTICTVKGVWNLLGLYPNVKIMQFMLEPKLNGFKYSNMKDDHYYWKPIVDLTKWNKHSPKDNEVYKCLQLLFAKRSSIRIIQKSHQTIESNRKN